MYNIFYSYPYSKSNSFGLFLRLPMITFIGVGIVCLSSLFFLYKYKTLGGGDDKYMLLYISLYLVMDTIQFSNLSNLFIYLYI